MVECQLPKLNTGVRFPSPAPRRSKVRFAPTSFYARDKKDVIRPLPCSSFPTATRWLAVGGPPCGRHFSPLRNIDFNRPFHVVAKSGFAATLFYARGRQPPPVSLFSSATRIPERSAARHPCGRHLPTSKYRNIDSNNPPNLKREDISKVPSLFFPGALCPAARPLLILRAHRTSVQQVLFSPAGGCPPLKELIKKAVLITIPQQRTMPSPGDTDLQVPLGI